MEWYWLVGLGVLVIVGLLSRRGERADTPRPQVKHGGGPLSLADIDALLQAGRKIEAIRLYRLVHRVDLKTAKAAIDQRARQLWPER